MKRVKFKIPGRICLFGDKIDLLGKPVIAATIEKFMMFEFETRDDGIIHFSSKEYPEEEETFSISDAGALFNYDVHLKYWHACLKSLNHFLMDGKIQGFNATVSTDIPIGAGLSTSAAVSVGFLRGLNELFDLGLDSKDIAEHAYDAEHNILGIMCGRMDQYSISFGGVTFISTGDEPSVDVLNVDCIPLVIGDSCEPREAKKVLNRVKKKVEEGDEVYLAAFQKIHDVVIAGKFQLENGCDLVRLGELMTMQQEQENVLGAATEKINRMCRVAIENGALGAKQMGAGGGGCMLACCPDQETQERVAKALNETGGKAEIVDLFYYDD
ncbi:MAG: mevalonate kinase family protein [Promethearchaeota archaeon]